MAQRNKIAGVFTRCIAAMLLGTVLLTGCGGGQIKEVDVESLEKENANTGGSLHDPFVIQGDDGTFYCYGSHMTAATSTDLYRWKSWANGVTKNNKAGGALRGLLLCRKRRAGRLLSVGAQRHLQQDDGQVHHVFLHNMLLHTIQPLHGGKR